MDRFLLAENPMNDGNCAVIHTVDPMAIIECIEGYEHFNSPYRQYSFVNTDGETEGWTLRVHHLFSLEFDSEQHHIIVTRLLDRAWHWYKAYMEWEDEQIEDL